MHSLYPYGKAPLIILIIALITGAILVGLRIQQSREREPDLTLATQAKNHEPAYRKAIAEFEELHPGVKIQLQICQKEAIQDRLQSALQTGSQAPDMVELLEGTIGFFTRGRLENVGFVDLTDRLKEEGLYDQFVQSRFALWSSRGHIFALPHDVHPVGLCYHRDIIAKLGIDVTKLKTWDDFIAMGKEVAKVKDADGQRTNYPLEMQINNNTALQILSAQRGADCFDAQGNVTMDSEEMFETIIWYAHQTVGPERIGYDPGDGQNLYRALQDGLVLFFFTPDWRTASFQQDLPNLKGKLGLIPMPVWEEGGLTSSTWGGTGLAITKQCKNQELAWEFAKFLYCKKEDLARRFSDTNILPPFKDAWTAEEFKAPSEFYGGQSLGQFFIGIADGTPPRNASPYTTLANDRILDVLLFARDYVERHPDDEEGLRRETKRVLKEKADYVREKAARNVFLAEDQKKAREAEEAKAAQGGAAL